MKQESIITNYDTIDDKTLDNTIRPETIEEYVGQNDVKDNIKVFIGDETGIEDDVTVIKTKFKRGSEEGTIAIVGPKRMDYDRVLSMLEYLKDNIER